MSTDETKAFHNSDELDQIIATHLQALQSNQAPSEDELLAQYPQFAKELKEFFADREQFEQMAQPMRGVVNAPAIGSQVRYIGDYELLDELGRGGMGVVYKAQQVSLKRLVAVKMILSGEHASEQDLSRFRAEVEAIAKLQHPNIVQIHEIGEHEGNPYAALEYVEGGSLADQLDGTPLSSQRAAALIETLARAVHVAHQQGIVHRDLKPANVLMTTDGQPKITDFGLAKLMKEESHKTRTGAILGTPSYMAPEQAEGKNTDIGPSTDVYALGAILYECLTGRPPFRAESPLETIKQVVSDEPVSPIRLQSGTPRDLETICLKCLQKEPAKRYGNAEELAEDLRRWMNGEPIHARPIGKMERTWKWIKRHPSKAGFLVTVGLLLLILMVGGPLVALRQAELRQQAETARKKAVAASNEVQQKLIEFLLRPFRGLQIATLEELAQLNNDEVRFGFLQQGLNEVETARGLGQSPDSVMLAVVGLHPERRQQALKALETKMREPNVASEIQEQCAVLGLHLESENPLFVDGGYKILLSDLDKIGTRNRLTFDVTKLIRYLDQPRQQKAAYALVHHLEQTRDFRAFEPLTKRLASLMEEWEPSRAGPLVTKTAKALIRQIGTRTSSHYVVRYFNPSLKIIEPHLDGEQANQIALAFLNEIERTGNQHDSSDEGFERARALVTGFDIVAKRLKQKHAANAVKILAKSFNKVSRSKYTAMTMALTFQTIARSMNPMELQRLVGDVYPLIKKDLTEATKEPWPSRCIGAWGELLKSIADHLTPAQAQEIAVLFIENIVVGSLDAQGWANGFRAIASKLDSDTAHGLIQTLFAKSQQLKDTSYKYRYYPLALEILTPRLNRTHAEKLAPILVQRGLSKAFQHLADQLKPEETNRFAHRMITNMIKRLQTHSESSAESIVQLCQFLDEPQIQQIHEQLAMRILRQDDKSKGQSLYQVQAMLRLGKAMNANQRKAILTQLADKLIHKIDPKEEIRELYIQAQAIESLVEQMDVKTIRSLASVLFTKFIQMTDPAVLNSLYKPMTKLASQLQPEQARTGTRELIERITRLENAREIYHWMSVYLELAKQLSEVEAENQALILIKHVNKIPNGYWYPDLVLQLHQLAGNLRAENIYRQYLALSEKVLPRVNSKLRGPLGIPVNNSRPQNTTFADVFEQLVKDLRDQELVNLLKHPNCFDKSQEVILQEFGQRYEQQFTSLWQFVAWVEQNKPEWNLRSPLVSDHQAQ